MKKSNCGLVVSVAGLRFELHGSLPRLEEFVCHSDGKSDGQIFITSEPLLNGTEKLAAEHTDVNVYIRDNGSWLYVMPKYAQSVQVTLDADCKTVKCYIADDSLIPVWRVLFRTAIECICVFNSRLSLHSACVDTGGEAVAFTGVSGTGKSTRADAWIKANSAEFISGDRPALSIDSDGVTVYGVPWDGKERVYRNIRRPLKAILDVRRSDTDYLRKLTPEQAQRVLVKQVFVPMWDASAAPFAIMNVRKLSESVPVYRVFCGPNEENAKRIYSILFNNSEEIQEAAEEMKIKEGFVLRNIADEYIVMPTGGNIAKFDGAVALNDVSAFIFEKMKNPVSKEDLLIAVLNEYDVDSETAAKDIDALVSRFEEMGIIE